MVSDVISITGNYLLDPLVTLWRSFVLTFPNIVLAILLLIIGYIVAWTVGHIIKSALYKVGLGKYIKKSIMTKTIGHTDLPILISEIVKWLIFLIFLQQAVSELDLGVFSNVLGSFIAWLPQLILAILVFFGGIAVAHYVDYKIKSVTVMRGMHLFSGILKVVIIFAALLVSLGQIGVNILLLENTFLILVGAAGLGFAIAVGLGFGLGLRNHAEDILKKFKKHI